MLAALDHFLHHEHRSAQALKRGGGKEFISWDAQEAEERYALEPADERTPDKEFDRRWALATLERVRGRLRAESVAEKQKNGALFDVFRPHSFGDLEAAPYEEIGSRLRMTPAAVRVTVHRLRARYGKLLRQEVAPMLADRGRGRTRGAASDRAAVLAAVPSRVDGHPSTGCLRTGT